MTIAEKMPTVTSSEEYAGRKEWLAAIDTLIEEVTEWSHSLGWRTAVHYHKAVDEIWPDRRREENEEYVVPLLDIITEQEYSGLAREVKLVMEPVFLILQETSAG